MEEDVPHFGEHVVLRLAVSRESDSNTEYAFHGDRW